MKKKATLRKTKETYSAGGVVINNEGKVLVVSQHGTSWSLPKGHIEEGEDQIEAAKRETAEESGVEDLKFVKKLGSYTRYKIGLNGGDDRTELKHITMFLFTSSHISPLKPTDPHNPEARWVSKEEVSDLLTHAKDREFYLQVKDSI